MNKIPTDIMGMVRELTELVLTPDSFGGYFHNHFQNRTECCDCGAPDDGDGNVDHAGTCPSITDEARHRRRLQLSYAIQASYTQEKTT